MSDLQPIPSTHTYSEIRWTIPGWVGRMQQKEPETYADIENAPISCGTEQAEIRNKCDHFIHIVPANIRERDEVFYCPKCGEKL